jgi:hypothetical protein
MRAGLLLTGVVLVSVGSLGFLDGAAAWLSWVDLLAGLAALAVVLAPDPRTPRGALELRAVPWTLSALLAVGWIAGLALAERWQAWFSFAAALSLALIALSQPTKQKRGPAAARPRFH